MHLTLLFVWYFGFYFAKCQCQSLYLPFHSFGLHLINCVLWYVISSDFFYKCPIHLVTLFVEMKPPPSQNESLFINLVPDSFHGDTYLLFFRDSNTRSDFVNMARFFGCMDQCDQQNMLQRIILFAPVIALCKYCKYCRSFNNFLFQKVYSHHFIHVFHSWMREKKRAFGCLHFVERILNGRIFLKRNSSC